MNRKDGQLCSLLNKRIELWENVEGEEKNELGQSEIIENRLKILWAGIIPQTGTLLSGRSADTALTQTTHKIITRYIEKIKPDMWMVYKGERYDILYVLDPYENHERLEIFCKVVI